MRSETEFRNEEKLAQRLLHHDSDPVKIFTSLTSLSLCVLLTLLPQRARPEEVADGEQKPNLIRPQSAVVSLLSNDLKDKFTIRHGAGFFVSADGVVATARHVLTGSSHMGGVTSDGRAFSVLGLVGEDPVHELILLKTDAGKVPFLHLGSSAKIKVTQQISIACDEFGFKGKTIKGVIATVENFADDYRWFVLDAPVAKGNSGSPVMDDTGEVVGILVGELSSFTQGWCIPSDDIKRLLAAARDAKVTKISDIKKRTYDDLFKDLDFQAALGAAHRGDNVEAVKKMALASQDFPESGACLVLLGSYHSNLKSWKEAEAAYRAAIKLKPDYALAWAFLGAVLALEGKRNDGFDACRKAIAIKPELPEAWMNLAGIFILSRDYDEARKAIEKLKSMHTKAADDYAANLTKGLDKAISPKTRVTP